MFLLAFRNIIRNRRRTFITLFLIISGTFLVGFLRFIGYGFEQDVIARVVRLDSGFLEISAYGYNEKPSVSRALEIKPGFFESLEAAGVSGYSPRIRAGALLSYKEKTRFVSVLAADSVKEKEITTISNVMQAGSLPAGRNEAAIGYRLARSLGLKMGDEFYIVTSQFDGSVGAARLRLTGIFNSSDSRLDSSRVMISLQSGEEIFGTVNEDEHVKYFTSIALNVENFIMADRMKGLLNEKFPAPEEDEKPEESSIFDPVVLGWQELNPGMVEIVKITAMKMDIFLVFFVISISFGVLNTVQMSIQERLRELGVLLAIGTKQSEVLKMLLWEVFLLVVPGVTIGMIFATATGMYYNANPIQLTGDMAEVYISIGFLPRWKPIVDIGELWLTYLSLILPAFLVSLFAVRRIFKLDPVRIINVL